MSMIQLQNLRDELLERMAAALNPLSEELDKHKKLPTKLENAVDELYEIYDYIEKQTTTESKERYFIVYCEAVETHYRRKTILRSNIITEGSYPNGAETTKWMKVKYPDMDSVDIVSIQELAKEDYEDYTRETNK